MVVSNLNIIKELVAYNSSLSIAEQLQVTQSFFDDYEGINPLLAEAVSLGVYEQLQVAVKGIALDAFELLYYGSSPEKINLMNVSYYGFAKEGFETMLKELMFEKSTKNVYLPELSLAYDRVNISLAKTILGLIIVLLAFDAHKEAGVLSQYLYMCSKVGD